MRVRMRMGVRLRMRVAMVLSRPVLVLMFMTVLVRMLVVLSVLVVVGMFVFVLVLGRDTRGIHPGQTATAFFTHYSISIEASSISRPARRSPLGWWHSGHSANKSSA